MKWLALLPLLVLPASAQLLPPSPPGAGTTKLLSPKHAEHLASLGTSMVKVSAALAPAQPQLWLAWNYPADQLTNVVFQVFHAFTLSQGPPLTRYDQIPNGFSLLSTVDGATTLSISSTAAAEFYIVRAQDKFSGVVSNWNQP